MSLLFNHGKLTAADMGLADTVLAAGVYNRIGQYQVLKGEEISPGFGGYSSMQDAVGRIYGILKTAADAEIKGTYQLVVESPQKIQLAPLGTYRTEDWNTVATDKTKQIPYPAMPVDITEGKYLVLYFMPDAAATIDHTKCILQMDITRRLLD